MKIVKNEAAILIAQFYGHTISMEKAINSAIICAGNILNVIDVYQRHQMTESEIETVEHWRQVERELKKQLNELK